ncbi:hypothetical protein R6Q59_010135 [Mikania micrantha]
MKAFGTISTVLAAASFFVNTVWADVDPIVIKGSKFFYKTNGTQFYIKGVAYQQEFAAGDTQSNTETTNTNYKDPLADASACQRDIPYLKRLGTNTIRVYAIDPTVNHDACMSAFASAGIYVVADLSAPGTSIIRNSPSWNEALYARYTSVIDNMAKYNNVLGFFAGNEVSNNATNTNASAYVKAAIRDMKQYIASSGYRTIGVGYATNDDADIREKMADYFDCGDPSQALDFWGYNIYSWCGASSMSQSGYDVRTQEFSSYNVPVFFAEYGCNEVKPRQFSEVAALFGPQMNNVWSGGIVYMYFQEANNYGLVSVSGSSVSTLTDFNNLATAIAKVTATGVNAASYTPTNTAPQACPTIGSDWQAATSLPPTPNSQLCGCMYKSLECVPNNIDAKSMGSLFGYVCGLNDGSCAGIMSNATKGLYGAYSMCNSTEQLGWVLNTYYQKQKKAGNGASACAFSGAATLQSSASPTGQCAALVSQAGSSGTGQVASGATGSGSSGGSGSSSSGNAAVVFASSPSLNFGFFHVAGYLLVAFLSGAGMILL